MGHYKVAGDARSSANFQVADRRKHLGILLILISGVCRAGDLSATPRCNSKTRCSNCEQADFVRSLQAVSILRLLERFHLTFRHDRRVMAAIGHRDLEPRSHAGLAFDLHIAAQQIDEPPH